MTAIDTDEFAWWTAALAGQKPPAHADVPQSGYYRMRAGRDGPWQPVCIWHHKASGKQVCRVGGAMREPTDVWTWVAKHPVAKDAAVSAFKTGQWPNDVTPPAPIGDNRPPTEITELIPMTIAESDEWLQSIGSVTSAQHADIAANRVAALRDLKTKAEAQHKTKKEPHLVAGRAVDAKYKPAIDGADGAIKRLLAAVTVYHTAEAARLRQEAAAEEARRRAEYERAVEAQRAEHAAKSVPEELELPPPPAPVTPQKVKSGGAVGKSVSLRTVKVATIVDYDKALAALSEHPDMRALVQTLADRACKAGVPLAGVEYSTKQVAA